MVTIDSDQGQSGASSADREGFHIWWPRSVWAQPASCWVWRSSTSGPQQCGLGPPLKICALSDILICDEDGLYNPSDFNDRLLLGLKGTMSEAELH